LLRLLITVEKKFGIEKKIKTIGDSYMAVWWTTSTYKVPLKNTVLAALEMQFYF
jgi:hypothetical protein